MGEISEIISAISDLAKSAKDTANTVKGVSSGIFKPSASSISSLALQGTANFPVIVPDDMDLDDALMISKSLERKFSTFLLTVLTMNPYMGIDNDSTPSAAEYLKQFHQNMDQPPTYKVDVPNALNTAKIMFESEAPSTINISDRAASFILEQSELGVDYNCWITESLQIVSAIYEGISDPRVNDKNIQFNYTMEEVTNPSVLNSVGAFRPTMEANNRPKTYSKKVPGNTINISPVINVSSVSKEKSNRSRNSGGSAIQNHLANNEFKKANELVPTLLHVRVYPYNIETSESLDPLDFIVGVKATLHPIPSSDMILNISRGLQNDGLFFNFIRWTTGEIKFFKDFLFAMDQQKVDAKNAGSSANGWWSALRRRRAKRNVIKKFSSGKNCLPNATIVCTVDMLEELKSSYGVNLTGSDTSAAQRLIDQYFLLAFVRVNPALQRVDFLFEGQSQYETVSYSTLSKEGGQDDRKFKDMMKMLGRGA